MTSPDNLMWTMTIQQVKSGDYSVEIATTESSVDTAIPSSWKEPRNI